MTDVRFALKAVGVAYAAAVALSSVSLTFAQPAAAQQQAQPPAQPAGEPALQQAGAPGAPGAPAATPPAPPPIPPQILGLREQVQALRAAQRRESQERITGARERLEAQRARTRAAIQRRDAAQRELDRLDAEFERNEVTLEETNARLELQQGNLGELFGVTRQVAGDTASALSQSLISTQIKDPPDELARVPFLREIAAARELPDAHQLRRLWYEIMREIVAGGKVVRYTAPVKPYDATLTEEQNLALPTEDRTVVRVGPFTAVDATGKYLGYLPSREVLTELSGELGAPFPAIGRQLVAAQPNAGYVRAVVDPSFGGALLGLYVERPNWVKRIEQGEVVGYVIVAVGLLGVALALVQAIYLVITRLTVGRQLRNLSDPRPNNPLGRVLIAYRGDGSRGSESAELAELRISEAVLREIPRLERFQAFLRLAVAAGPLLGLIGTVIGMIITFKAITASGSSDPKLMAQGIGQAMIATVLGLGIAIPLLFINSGLAAMSRAVTQILDEQSHSLLAARGSSSA